MRRYISCSKICSFLCNVIAAAFLFLFSCNAPALAQDAAASEQEIIAANEALREAAVMGPQTVQLGTHASIALSEDYAFVPNPAAAQFMRSRGYKADSEFIGLLVSKKMDGLITVGFFPEGYIKDDDAQNWNIDGILASLEESTRQTNLAREKRGLPALELRGWIEKPSYDARTHRLTWSVAVSSAGAPANEPQGVNYNTYLLGRRGYLSLNLVTDTRSVEQEKPLAKELLSAVSFHPGDRYEDFNPATDHVAEYGLAALVAGIAVKKLGLLAAVGVFLAKAWKFALVGLIACVAIFKRFVRHGKAA